MENTTGHDDMLVLPDEIIGTIVSFIIDTKTVLNVALTSKRLNKLLHSKQFWCQNGGTEFNKYAAFWNDRIPSHIVDVIVYSKSLIDSGCSCQDKIDEVLPNLIPKLVTNDPTEVEEAVREVDEIFSCIFCDDNPCIKFVFGGLIPRYIHFLSKQSTPSIQRSVLWMFRRLCFDSHYANAVVHESGVSPLIETALHLDTNDNANESVNQSEAFQLIQMMKKSRESKCQEYARQAVHSIIQTNPHAADLVIRLLLEQKFPVLNTPQYNLFVRLLTPCVAQSTDLDPRKLVCVIERLIELMLKDGSLVDISLVLELFTPIVTKSHHHPSVIELMLSDDVIERSIASIPPSGNAEAYRFFTEILKYDASLAQRIRNDEILQKMHKAGWLLEDKVRYVTQLLQNDKTIENTIQAIVRYKFVPKSVAVYFEVGYVYHFLVKFVLAATDEQIQKSVTWRDNDGRIVESLHKVLKCSDGPEEQQNIFRGKMYKLLTQWQVELKSEDEKDQLEALELVISDCFGDRN